MKRYNEERIIKAIRLHEYAVTPDDNCREIGIPKGTFYKWRSVRQFI